MNRHFSRCCPGGFTSVVLPRFWHPAPLDSNLQARTPAGPPVYRRPNSAGRRSASQLAGENGQFAFLTAFPDALLAGPSETGVPRLRFPEYRCASAFFEPVPLYREDRMHSRCRGGFTSAILPRFWHPAPAYSDPPVRTPTVPPVFRRPNPAGRRIASQSTGEGR